MGSQPIPDAGSGSGLPLRPAGFWIRAAALLIDGVVLLPLALAPFYAFFTAANPGLAAFLCAPALLYKPLMEGWFGATLGKMVCGVRVLDRRRGGRIGLGAAYLRFSPLLLQSLFGIAVMAGAFTAPQFRMVSGFLGVGLIVQWGPTDTLGVLLNAVILLDCAAAAFTSRKRAFHDMLAGSVCVRSVAEPAAAGPRR